MVECRFDLADGISVSYYGSRQCFGIYHLSFREPYPSMKKTYTELHERDDLRPEEHRGEGGMGNQVAGGISSNNFSVSNLLAIAGLKS